MSKWMKSTTSLVLLMWGQFLLQRPMVRPCWNLRQFLLSHIGKKVSLFAPYKGWASGWWVPLEKKSWSRRCILCACVRMLEYVYACIKRAHTRMHTHTHLETQTQNNKEPIINKRNLITYHAYNIKTKQPKLKKYILKQ